MPENFKHNGGLDQCSHASGLYRAGMMAAALRAFDSEIDDYASEVALWKGTPQMGYSFSTNQAVLSEARREYLETGALPERESILPRALAAERKRAKGRAVGGQDVGAVLHGGAVKVVTSTAMGVTVSGLDCEQDLISGHFVLAYHPSGRRHDVPTLLEEVLDHPLAAWFVTEVSKLGCAMAQALPRHDLDKVARLIGTYNELFDSWMRGRYFNEDVRKIIEGLRSALGPDLRAAKPPGGGAASSVVALVAAGRLGAAIEYFHGQGWIAEPVRLADGLTCEDVGHGWAYFRAGHRVDLIGAADLGIDRKIRRNGVCVAMAVEPVSEVWARRCPTSAGTMPRGRGQTLLMSEGLGI